MTRRRLAVLVTLLGLVWFAPVAAWAGCPEILSFLAGKAVDVVCFDSSDLTTNNAQTTPPNNSLPVLPPFAFTPQIDRGVISPNPPDRTPIAGPVPGIQVEGYLAGDPTGEARFLLRLPTNWNGQLVVAGPTGSLLQRTGVLNVDATTGAFRAGKPGEAVVKAEHAASSGTDRRLVAARASTPRLSRPGKSTLTA